MGFHDWLLNYAEKYAAALKTCRQMLSTSLSKLKHYGLFLKVTKCYIESNMNNYSITLKHKKLFLYSAIFSIWCPWFPGDLSPLLFHKENLSLTKLHLMDFDVMDKIWVWPLSTNIGFYRGQCTLYIMYCSERMSLPLHC